MANVPTAGQIEQIQGRIFVALKGKSLEWVQKFLGTRLIEDIFSSEDPSKINVLEHMKICGLRVFDRKLKKSNKTKEWESFVLTKNTFVYLKDEWSISISIYMTPHYFPEGVSVVLGLPFEKDGELYIPFKKESPTSYPTGLFLLKDLRSQGYKG